MNILIIEHENNLASYIKTILEMEGHTVSIASDINEVLEKHLNETHDLIIFDLCLNMKKKDYLINSLKKENSSIPLLILTPIDQLDEKLELFDMGADDILLKPFYGKELIARVKALYKRNMIKNIMRRTEYRNIEIYWKQNKILRSGKEIILTKKEIELLKLLLLNPGEIINNEDILMKIWGKKPGFHSNIVQTTVCRLRTKLDTGFVHKLIHNIHGIGYKLILP